MSKFDWFGFASFGMLLVGGVGLIVYDAVTSDEPIPPTAKPLSNPVSKPAPKKEEKKEDDSKSNLWNVKLALNNPDEDKAWQVFMWSLANEACSAESSWYAYRNAYDIYDKVRATDDEEQRSYAVKALCVIKSNIDDEYYKSRINRLMGELEK